MLSAKQSPSKESGTGEDVESSSTSWKRRFGLGKRDKTKSNSGSPPQESTSPTLHPTDAPEAPPSTAKATTPLATDPPQLPKLTDIPPITTSPPSATVRNAGSQTQSPTPPIQSLGSSSSPHLVSRPNTASHSSATHPRLSTSSSQIFERNVQEQTNSSLPPPTSPAIPAHIQTENHIPAVLEASSIAITDEKCGVDEVEIIMHSMHQPAVSVVAPPHSTTASSPTYDTHQHRRRSPSPAGDNAVDEPASAGHSGDECSPNGSMGSGAATAVDKRRLSFISFADVVQAEQAEHAEHMEFPNSSLSSINNLSPLGGSPQLSPADGETGIPTINEALRHRSPSPIRLGSSPSGNSASGSVQRPLSGRSGASSPSRPSTSDFGMDRGELTIETMRQALRKTGSGDLSGSTGRNPASPPPFGR
ncbi:unnamed protein product [Tuber melanosporum]|uniref:(Perigord truffle) hypothetical protein n=1 Tax=Tuber melanosporum (strain Mel28) TaxID=656061 RepID=D5GPS5_TUBMM|nr:uncharacterized protein GSTUM_00012008001 [Tuber melanosporum]CAZ86518.1 unnamed protein product [Tuber melanosporum]